MKRLLPSLLVLLLLSLVATRARAEGTAPVFDPATCGKTPAATAPEDRANAPPPVTWNDFEIEGPLRDDPAIVRRLIEPTLVRHRALTDAAREDIARITNAFGYHLVGLTTKETPGGVHAVVQLAPMPMVRRIKVDVDQGWFDTLLEDEVRRRMRVRIGAYMPWDPATRACDLYEEERRIQEFLRDEGFIDARVNISQNHNALALTLTIKVRLGDDYTAGIINIAPREPDGVGDDEIRSKFRHTGRCLIFSLCWGHARFKRTQHQQDIQDVAELFHQRGFPAVRVRTDFDPLTSFDRRTKRVNFTVTIDTRRQLDVKFEGYDENAVSDQDLRKQLTFDQAASSDDVEAAASAKNITTYLQGRGYYDARVTWWRERFEKFDRLVFRIDQGRTRRVKQMEYVGISKESGVTAAQLGDAIGEEARTSTSLFGDTTATTSEALAIDVEQIHDIYRRAGYRDARVTVSAATDPAGLDSAAMTAALLALDRGDGIYIRYTIEEGPPTLLTEIHINLGPEGDAITTPDQRKLCGYMLKDVADLYGDKALARPMRGDRCIASAPNLKFRENDALDMRDRLKDKLFGHGRPRAKVAYEASTIGPHRVALNYTLSDIQPLTIGKVVVRGNFRTNTRLIRDQLDLVEGAPLTNDALADSARRLRNTTLFDAVNVALPDLENTSEGAVNVVVEVAERYDLLGNLDVEVGYSSFNGAFLRLLPSFKNLFGRGISLDLVGTIGFDTNEAFSNNNLKLRQLAAEATLRFPQWLTRHWPVEFQTEINGFHRRQDTERFGLITTDGITVALSRTWQRQRIGTRAANAKTIGLHYDFRLRERPVDVLRPLGADDDQSQVPITTRTGLVGITAEWEQRTDRNGALSPLAPEAGFRIEGQASLAAPYFLGQDTFIKLTAAGSKFWPLASHLVLRADLRYDQGIPLGGAVLLPEVERFFAGGDSTVRGYEDDRLATELIQVGVPPLSNVQQIRVLPAGGNIRVMGSLDAQLRIWKVLASAVFFDAGLITNQWTTVSSDDLRPSVGIALARVVTPFGLLSVERAIPLSPRLGDDPRGRWHFNFAARAQF